MSPTQKRPRGSSAGTNVSPPPSLIFPRVDLLTGAHPQATHRMPRGSVQKPKAHRLPSESHPTSLAQRANSQPGPSRSPFLPRRENMGRTTEVLLDKGLLDQRRLLLEIEKEHCVERCFDVLRGRRRAAILYGLD